MADMIEALGMLEIGMESSRARRTRSVCVVALYTYVRNCDIFEDLHK